MDHPRQPAPASPDPFPFAPPPSAAVPGSTSGRMLPPLTPPQLPGASAEPGLPKNPFVAIEHQLDWSRKDIERRLGFRGGRYTSPSKPLSFVMGLLLTVAFYALIVLALRQWPEFRSFSALFLERGPCPFAAMLLFFWSIAYLFLKRLKLGFQSLALALPVMPQQPDFELTPATARSVRERMSVMVDNPHHFVLLNRIDLALANLHNIGQASDVATILKIQAENDEAQVSSSYTMIQGFLWAIPVIGFIGTVLGLSEAIGAFATTLQSGADMELIRSSLQGVTGGLGTAFDTTLVALVCALILQLMITFLQSRESEFLDQCNDVCHKQVAGKLKLQTT
jgi:biopolymer transport protein ExbB/TolQ